jgi:DNA recombination-dependent growth factor C
MTSLLKDCDNCKKNSPYCSDCYDKETGQWCGPRAWVAKEQQIYNAETGNCYPVNEPKEEKLILTSAERRQILEQRKKEKEEQEKYRLEKAAKEKLNKEIKEAIKILNNNGYDVTKRDTSYFNEGM